jgi:hypothetical protein
MATVGPAGVQSHLRFRVLVPFLSRWVCAVSNGHTGSWDPLIFSFLAGIKRLPRSWIAAAGTAALTAFALNAYHSTVGGGGGGVGRYIFDVAGPLLSLSAAAFLSDLNEGKSPAGLN